LILRAFNRKLHPGGSVVLAGENVGQFKPESGEFIPFKPATQG
jgi:hypothetical protein